MASQLLNSLSDADGTHEASDLVFSATIPNSQSVLILA